MNRNDIVGMPAQSRAYSAAQDALSKVPESLQVEESLSSLRSVVEFHNETVRALLRRLEPVTIQYGSKVQGLDADSPAKVQIATSIDYQVRLICELTGEVQDAIRALQI